MNKVNLNTVCAAHYTEVLKRKQELQKLKKELIIVSKDIEDIQFRYFESLYKTYKETLCLDIQRKMNLRNRLVESILTLLDRSTSLLDRRTSSLTINGDIYRFRDNKRARFEPIDKERFIKVARSCFENDFFNSTPFIVRTIDDSKGVLLGRDSISVNEKGMQLVVDSSPSGYTHFSNSLSTFKPITEYLLEGDVDLTVLPEYLQKVVEENKDYRFVVGEERKYDVRFTQDYRVESNGKSYFLQNK